MSVHTLAAAHSAAGKHDRRDGDNGTHNSEGQGKCCHNISSHKKQHHLSTKTIITLKFD